MKKDKIAIVMAAGKSTAMNSKKSKLVHKLYGKELVSRVVEVAEKVDCDEIVTVVGDKKEQIMEVLKDRTKYVFQDEALGTGHAILQAIPELESKKGQVVVLYGDVPIIKKETLESLIDRNRNERESATLLTAIADNPTGYGRIVRNEIGEIQEIVEENYANDELKKIREINSGIYCFDIEALLDSVKELKAKNDGQIYLTDIIKIMKNKNLKVGTIIVADNTEILGVNDRVQLELLGRILKMRINAMHMLNGVTIEDSDSTYIYDDVKIGKDTIIHSNTTIESSCVIGNDCEIGPNACIRERCNLADDVKIGNCVEVKNSVIKSGTRVSALSYIDNSDIGNSVSISSGTVTCDYGDVENSRTIIGDDCFVSAGTELVAPLNLGKNAFIAAGSTITEDVPNDSLASSREKQNIKKGWNA